jgi:hypothetical protein
MTAGDKTAVLAALALKLAPKRYNTLKRETVFQATKKFARFFLEYVKAEKLGGDGTTYKRFLNEAFSLLSEEMEEAVTRGVTNVARAIGELSDSVFESIENSDALLATIRGNWKPPVKQVEAPKEEKPAKVKVTKAAKAEKENEVLELGKEIAKVESAQPKRKRSAAPKKAPVTTEPLDE